MKKFLLFTVLALMANYLLAQTNEERLDALEQKASELKTRLDALEKDYVKYQNEGHLVKPIITQKCKGDLNGIEFSLISIKGNPNNGEVTARVEILYKGIKAYQGVWITENDGLHYPIDFEGGGFKHKWLYWKFGGHKKTSGILQYIYKDTPIYIDFVFKIEKPDAVLKCDTFKFEVKSYNGGGSFGNQEQFIIFKNTPINWED